MTDLLIQEFEEKRHEKSNDGGTWNEHDTYDFLRTNAVSKKWLVEKIEGELNKTDDRHPSFDFLTDLLAEIKKL